MEISIDYMENNCKGLEFPILCDSYHTFTSKLSTYLREEKQGYYKVYFTIRTKNIKYNGRLDYTKNDCFLLQKHLIRDLNHKIKNNRMTITTYVFFMRELNLTHLCYLII